VIADGWRCPECSLILAPSVTEHRCDPPSAGVLAVKPDPDAGPDTAGAVTRAIQRNVYSIAEVRARLSTPPWVHVNLSTTTGAM
jgi:hypothetical protein